MNQALRIVKPTDRPLPSQEDGPQRLRDIIDMPEWMFARGLASIDVAAMTYECPVHGIILPRKFANGYRRRECPCMWERRQAESVQRHQEAMQHALGTKQAERCYTWLGKDAQEIGLEAKTFGNFDRSIQTDAFTFCSNYDPLRDPSNVIFMGSVGTGKTHLAAAIVNRQRAKGVPCLWATAQNLFNALYATRDFEEQQAIKARFGTTTLAVLDDIGKLYIKPTADPAQTGKYQKDVLFEIINRRYTRGLPTIITTNEPESLTQCFDDANATLDRLYEHCKLLVMNGNSYRKVLAKQHKNGG